MKEVAYKIKWGIVQNILWLRQTLHHHWNRIRYYGNRVMCPICDGKFRTFVDYGNRRNARCPGCGSMERHRTLWLWLRSKIENSTSPLRILHIAPEPGIENRLSKAKGIKYIRGDLHSNLVDAKFDLTNLPFKNESFDLIICVHVLEHVIYDNLAIGELYRVCKYKGMSVIDVPIFGEVTYEDPAIVSEHDRMRVYGQKDHVRKYGYDFFDKLSTAGFSVYKDSSLLQIQDEDRMSMALGKCVLRVSYKPSLSRHYVKR